MDTTLHIFVLPESFHLNTWGYESNCIFISSAEASHVKPTCGGTCMSTLIPFFACVQQWIQNNHFCDFQWSFTHQTKMWRLISILTLFFDCAWPCLEKYFNDFHWSSIWQTTMQRQISSIVVLFFDCIRLCLHEYFYHFSFWNGAEQNVVLRHVFDLILFFECIRSCLQKHLGKFQTLTCKWQKLPSTRIFQFFQSSCLFHGNVPEHIAQIFLFHFIVTFAITVIVVIKKIPLVKLPLSLFFFGSTKSWIVFFCVSKNFPLINCSHHFFCNNSKFSHEKHCQHYHLHVFVSFLVLEWWFGRQTNLLKSHCAHCLKCKVKLFLSSVVEVFSCFSISKSDQLCSTFSLLQFYWLFSEFCPSFFCLFNHAWLWVGSNTL